MRFTITRGQRSTLLCISAASYLAWFAGIGEPTDARDAVQANPASITVSPWPLPPNVAVAIKRDPFAGAPGHESLTRDARPQYARAAVEAGDAVPDIADVPNADVQISNAATASTPVADVPATLVLRATIVGHTALAYVADGTAMQIVRVGDSLGELRVAKIKLGGITFADGSRLLLVTQHEPTPPAPRPRTTGPRQAPTVVPVATNASRAPVPVSTQPAPATPEPQRTVDPTGIAPGTNPTPDLRDPTAYPYPYPYPAPPHR